MHFQSEMSMLRLTFWLTAKIASGTVFILVATRPLNAAPERSPCGPKVMLHKSPKAHAINLGKCKA